MNAKSNGHYRMVQARYISQSPRDIQVRIGVLPDERNIWLSYGSIHENDRVQLMHQPPEIGAKIEFRLLHYRDNEG